MATIGVCRDCLVPVEFDGHVYTCPECGAHTRYDMGKVVAGIALLSVEVTPGLARKFGLTYIGTPGEHVEMPYLRRQGQKYVPCKYPNTK